MDPQNKDFKVGQIVQYGMTTWTIIKIHNDELLIARENHTPIWVIQDDVTKEPK